MESPNGETDRIDSEDGSTSWTSEGREVRNQALLQRLDIRRPDHAKGHLIIDDRTVLN